MRGQLLIFLLCIGILNGANELDVIPYNESFDGAEVELLISYKMVSKDNVALGEQIGRAHV